MLLPLVLCLGKREYIDLPPTNSDLAVIVSGCAPRLVLEGITPAFRGADVYVWLTTSGLKPFDQTFKINQSLQTDFKMAKQIKDAVESVNGSLRFISFEDEVDPDVGEEVKGRMHQYNVWKGSDLANKRGRAILRRWNSAGYLFNKTGNVHKKVLWLREDLALVAPLSLELQTDIAVRPCKDLGGVSDKVFLMGSKAAMRVMPRLVPFFLGAPPDKLLGHNPESILKEAYSMMGLSVAPSSGIYFTDAVKTEKGVCFKPYYLCERLVRPVKGVPYNVKGNRCQKT